MLIVGGDAHPSDRRVGVVQLLPRDDLVVVLGRTTKQPKLNDRCIPSPVTLECSLDKSGWWIERHKHSIDRRHFGTPACQFLGTLPPAEMKALEEFWEQVRWG